VFRIMITILLAGLASMTCSAEFRDPTQPAYPLPSAGANIAVNTELVLSAIWISSQSKRATINGISAKQGQTIIIPLATPNGSSNLPRPQEQSTMSAATNTPQQTNNDQQSSQLAPIPARSTTIKIISIHKNSVTIEQNGEIKTLILVQRPYKTQ
jgi:hypothetical protein